MTVAHSTLGTGTVISQDAENVTVDFNGTVKTLVIKFARLTNEDGTPFGQQFVAPVKNGKKLNRANFMSVEEFNNSEVGRMSQSEWEAHREAKMRDSLPSNLR